jgi:hypothetical protein
MENIQLSCPEGEYISSLKSFGFLYKLDKRLNKTSNGESFCHADMFPNDDPLDVNNPFYI